MEFTQQVKITANDETTINAAITTQAASGWNFVNLVDKPASNQVYLLFIKPVTVEV